METINIKNLPISSNNNLKTVIGFNENDELIKATYSNNGGGVVDLTDYYTKEEVYTKEQVDSIADNYYNDYMDDYRYLNGRIDNLENNGGGSSGGGKESVVIDLGVTTEPNLTKEQIIEIADNFLSKKYTIKYVDTDEANTDYQLRLIDIIAVNDTREGDDPAKYVELVGVTININIEFLKWRFQQGSFNISDSITLEKESISKIVWEYLVPLMSNVSNLETKATDIENRAFNNVDSLENQIKENTDRLDNLENNGGGSSEGGNDVVYFNFEIEDGEFNVNDDFGFKIVAQALKENKIVYVNGCLVTSYYIDDDLMGYISIVNANFIFIYDANFANFSHNKILVSSQSYTIPTEDFIDYTNDEVSSLNDRLTTLENKVQELENKTN
jgi:hypothetical protein